MAVDEKVELKKGLKNVFFDRTQTGSVDPAGKLLYRGYNIHDLAEHSTFEETCYLLFHGSLPTSSQLEELDGRLKANRRLPDEILRIIRLTKSAHPMDVLRTAVSAMSSSDPDASNITPEAVSLKGIRLTAAASTIVAALARIRKGKEPVAPRSDLSHAANFLYMLFGEMPNPEDARLIDKDLVLHAEHGVNASTFATRVAASTRADLYSAITAGIAVLKGPLHGGAAEGVWQLAQEIGNEENAEEYVAKLLNGGGRVMGMGHPVYKAVDPRSVHLKSDAEALGKKKGQPRWFSILKAVTETEAVKKRARRGLNPNVDFWAGAVYHLLGIPYELFIPLFAMGRMPGWTAHVIEQYAQKDLQKAPAPLQRTSGPEVRADRRTELTAVSCVSVK